MAKQELNLGIQPNDNTGDTLRDGGQKINDNFSELYDYTAISLGTGVIYGGAISIPQGETTQVSIEDGEGIIVDYYTNPLQPTFNKVQWVDKVGVEITNIATQPVTYILIDINGDVRQQINTPTLEELREYILIGVAVHSDNTQVELINDLRVPMHSPTLQLHDLVRTLGRVNTGNIIAPNVTTTTMSIQKGAGTIYGVGINIGNNLEVPNLLTTPALSPATFRYRDSASNEGASISDIDPNQYESSTGVLSSVGGGQWTNQRVYLFPSNQIRIQWGQEVYGNKSQAIQGLQTESFTEEPNIAGNAVLLGIITIRGNTTDLNNDSRVEIRNVGKLGEVATAQSGASISSMQNTYTNSVQPHIILDSTRLGIDIRDSLAGINDILFSISNNDGSIKHFSVENGKLHAGSLPVYDNDSSAGTGGLVAGDVYRTSTGELRIKL